MNEQIQTQEIQKRSYKKLVMPLMVVLSIGLIVAGVYYVNTLTLNVGVKEAFEVSYAILGDGEDTWVGHLCSDEGTQWFVSDVIDTSVTDTMLPGQKRFVCVKIENEAGELPYTITSSIVGGDGSDYDYNQKCLSAFGQYTISGVTVAGDGSIDGITYTGFEVVVADNAPVVTGCIAKINVGRGTI